MRTDLIHRRSSSDLAPTTHTAEYTSCEILKPITSNGGRSMLNHHGSPFVLDAVTGPNTLDQIQGLLDRLWEQHPDVSPTARIHMELAACEIGANILKHAGGGQPVRMRMEADVHDEAVRVSFTDDGHPAPVDLNAVSMPTEMAEQGRGLALAVAVLDELSFHREAKINRWTLVRRLAD